VFADLVGERGYTSMLDRNFVEWFKAVNYAKRFSILLDYTEPARAIRRIGGLIDSCVELVLDKPTDLVVDTGWYRDIALGPWLVRNGRYFDWWEEVFAEVASLFVGPSEGAVLQAHKLMDKFALLWEKEVACVYAVELLFAFSGVSTGWYEVGWPSG